MCENAKLDLTHRQAGCILVGTSDRRCGPNVRRRDLYELKGKGRSMRGIAGDLGRGTRRKTRSRRRYRSPGSLIAGRVHGVHRQAIELRGKGASGVGIRGWLQHAEELRAFPATESRFGRAPVSMDWGVFSYIADASCRMWAFVMVLGWSRAIYAEFVRRADEATFIRCHLNAFDYFECRVAACTTTPRWWYWGGTRWPCSVERGCWTSPGGWASR